MEFNFRPLWERIPPRQFFLTVLILCVYCFLNPSLGFAQELTASKTLLSKIEKKYGPNAVKRIQAWESLMAEDKQIPEMKKLTAVNNFFNTLTFHSDIAYLGVADYWMTPIEFLSHGAGECKDYAIAKYFTLRTLGVAMDKMRITYVKALNLNQAHMVLAYYPIPESDPLILDSLTSEILPASKRTDLEPVYSFNGESLWLAKERGEGQYMGSSGSLSKWRAVLQHMAAEQSQ